MQAWVSYLNQVLGVKQFLHPYAPVTSVLRQLVFVLDVPLRAPTEEMFDKIIAALKLQKNQVRVVLQSGFDSFLSAKNENEEYIFISLGENNYSEITHISPSLEQMLHQPSLKKQAWEIFQKAALDLRQES